MTLSELDIMARTVWAESRGEARAGMIAVAWAIRNRANRHHRGETTIAGVCTEPWQFSCWNPSDPNRDKLEAVSFGNDPRFMLCWYICLGVMLDEYADPTKGSGHYCTLNLAPSWARGKDPAVVIGNHKFYNDIA